MLDYHTIPVTPFTQNCSLVWDTLSLKAAVIDPGGDLPLILNAAKARSLTIEQIWLTHAHIDHAGAAADLAEALFVPIIGPHPDDQFWIDGLAKQSKMFGFAQAKEFTPTQWLFQGDTVHIGQERLEVYHCPGHTPGHVVFHARSINRIFVGDVLFHGSIGRSDFPRGNHQQLLNSIQTQLLSLADDTIFISGHGPESTIGIERAHNPHLQNLPHLPSAL